MRRRQLLTGGFCGLVMVIAGCLERGDSLVDGGTPTPTRTPTPPPPGEAISYDDLDEPGAAFVDAALDGYTIRWVNFGGERRYLSSDEANPSVDDDPLLPDDSSDLEPIVEGDALLELDGTHFSMLFTTGHGTAGLTLESTPVEACPGESVAVMELPDDEVEIAEELVDQTHVTIAEPGFEAALLTDHSLPDEAMLELAEVAINPDSCLTEGETPYQLQLEEHFFFMDRYELMPVD